MPKVINTSTGTNFLKKFNSPVDKTYINEIQLYNKQLGNEGSANTVFTLNGTYIPGSNTLLVFINGQKAEKVVSASSAMEYEETSVNSVTFGSALLDTDVVEFYVTGTYNLNDLDMASIIGYALTEAQMRSFDAAGMSIMLGANITLTSNFSPTVSINTNGYTLDGAYTLTISSDFIGSIGCFGSSITVVFGIGSSQYVRPEYWGTGAGAILKAVDSVEEKGIPVSLTGGTTYQFSTTLNITTDNMVIRGSNTSSQSNTDSESSILEYTGSSGTAIQIGVSPGASITMLRNVILENLTIKVTENTDVAIDLWQCTGTILNKIYIEGNSDDDASYNYGLRIRGGVNNFFNMVTIRGNGNIGTSSANWLRYGVYIDNGYGGDPATTITFQKLYVHSCWRGLNHGTDSHATYYDSVFESCTTKAMEIYGTARFYGCWWEDVPEAVYVSFGASTTKQLVISGSQSINIGTNQYFITAAAATERIVLIGNKFQSTHASPVIVQTSGTAPIVTSIGNTFSANTSLIEPAYAHLATVFNVEEGVLSTAFVNHTKSYTSTGNISAIHLKGYRLNNYGQTTDTILTFPTAEVGMNAVFEIVDTSNYLHFAPPSGTSFLFVDSTGTITVMAVNEKIVIAQVDMAVGEELKITTYQTGASTYGYKVVQTIGDGAAQESP